MKNIQTVVVRCIAVVVVAAVFLSGCATTSVAYEEGARLRHTGNLSVLLSKAAPQVSVIIDDRILVDARCLQTRRVDVEGIPVGPHRIKVFANSWQLSGPVDYSAPIDINEGGTLPIVIQVPAYSTLYWVYVIAIAVVSVLPTIVVVY